MAGTISEEDIQKVREASDLVAIIGERTPVKQRGRDFWCCCPLHNEKTPSFKIDPVLQLWHCFGCNEGGDVFGFLMKTEDLSFPEAVRKLAERAHIDIAETGGRGGVPSSQEGAPEGRVRGDGHVLPHPAHAQSGRRRGRRPQLPGGPRPGRRRATPLAAGLRAGARAARAAPVPRRASRPRRWWRRTWP